jgi:hypothetical protein
VQLKGSYSATCNGRPLADCRVRKIRQPKLHVKCVGLWQTFLKFFDAAATVSISFDRSFLLRMVPYNAVPVYVRNIMSVGGKNTMNMVERGGGREKVKGNT